MIIKKIMMMIFDDIVLQMATITHVYVNRWLCDNDDAGDDYDVIIYGI